MALELFTIQQPFEVNFSGNPINYTFACAPYGRMEQKQDIRIQVRVEKEVSPGAGIYREIKSQILFPDTTGKISFDISTIADAYLSWYTPRALLAVVSEVTGQSSRFRAVVVALKDNILITDPFTTDPVMIIKGGLAKEQMHYSKFFEQNIKTDYKPLHFFSAKEWVRTEEVKFLTWLYPLDDHHEQTIRITVNLLDGTSWTQDAINRIPSNKWGMYILPLNLKQLLKLFLTVTSPSAVKSYTLNIRTDTHPVMNDITFHVDFRAFYYNTNILYTNSVGGFDNIAMLGDIEHQADYTSNNTQQVSPPSGMINSILQHEEVDTQNTEVEKFSGSTDFISEAKLNLLRDLLLSRNVYEHKFGKLIPVRIIKKSSKFYSTKDQLFAMLIEWQHALANNFYTPPYLIADDIACPAMAYFNCKQLTKNKIQVMWSLPLPYDLFELEIDNGNPAELQTMSISGNNGSIMVEFINPAVSPATADITLRARVICNPDSDPVDVGPYTTQVLTVTANTLPIANDDTYSIAAGYIAPEPINGNPLENDYDPDGDAIECVPVIGGATAEGGTFDIDAAGNILYQAPTSIFNGIDSFPYTIREVATPAATATGTVRIHVGNIGLGNQVYVKVTERNHYSYGYLVHSGGDYYVSYFADPMCTVPKNVTGLGLTINMETVVKLIVGGTTFIVSTTPSIVAASGLESHFYSGDTSVQHRILGIIHTTVTEFHVLAGAGYIPV